MSKELLVEVLTPGRRLLHTHAQEVYLPAHDGETGILPGHGDFVGLLGTGVLRASTGGQHRRYFICGGLYSVQGGALTVFAEQAESAEEIDLEQAESRVNEIEAIFYDTARFRPEDYDELVASYLQNRARAEAAKKSR